MIVMAKTMKHLDATGKGEFDYDYSHDILFFKIKDREYGRSMEIDNLVVDIDKKDFVVGLQVFDASEFLQIPKIALKSIDQWKLDTKIEENRLEVRLLFRAVQRNKVLEMKPIILEPLKEPLPNSEMVMTAKQPRR